MSIPNVNTGSPKLDADLNNLFEICDSEKRLAEIKSAIQNDSISDDDFHSIVSASLQKLTLICRIPQAFEELLQKGQDEESRKTITRAKELIETHFLGILGHPAFLRRYAEKGTEVSDPFNRITSVGHFATCVGKPPLTPMVRFTFRSRAGDSLLVSTLEWDDAVFVASAIVGALAENMDDVKELRSHLEIPDVEDFHQHMKNLTDRFAKLRQLAEFYGLDSAEEEDVEVEEERQLGESYELDSLGSGDEQEA